MGLETEHMPPRFMFIGKQRPAGMEFDACGACNRGTSVSDLVAGTIARVNSSFDALHARSLESTDHIGKLNRLAPGFVDEIMGSDERLVLHLDRGCWRVGHEMHINGPLVHAYLSVFGAKLGMALYREHVGDCLPLAGAVQSTWYTNIAQAEKIIAEILNKLPSVATLRQGKWSVDLQFAYRYFTDNQSMIIAVVAFHNRLFYVVSAFDERERIGEPLDIPTSTILRPGELLAQLPARRDNRPQNTDRSRSA